MDSIVRIVDNNTRLVTVPVNHDERILAFPGHDWATEDKREARIEERTGVVEEEIILRRFGHETSSVEVIAELATETVFGEDGLEPVSPEDLRDLLKVAGKDPNLPTNVAGLGVSWSGPAGYRGEVGIDAAGRCLYLVHQFKYGFYDARWWFAARRKSKR